ncbi:hypothetical protein [Tranquillimonas alkanivorans]|uniref:Uncharacterized protein n=1 Tax=Tranquillimonas alkanivorans TaxID=441119 RepID=A0A1I5QBK2_9RHOB|nr:hypothetical protein [Tranquillimonas alkanivorans]SFP43226.1 hypothetical protein SAMN04488047_106146 [Tranquillimonas alkanivorans]
MTKIDERARDAELSHTPPGEEPPKRLLEEGSVWIMIAAPCIWALHFLLSYWAAAVWCAKLADRYDPILPVRAGVAVLTLVALAVVAWLARYAVRRYQGRLLIQEDLTEHSEAERTRFLGHATLLLCALSAAAIIFDSMPILVFDSCY